MVDSVPTNLQLKLIGLTVPNIIYNVLICTTKQTSNSNNNTSILER